jgi:transient receptor potential cation channel subfamily C member 4
MLVTYLRMNLFFNFLISIQFVAHPNVQQLLATMWYDGLPGFRRLNPISRLFAVAQLGAMFPLNSFIYMMAPNTKKGQLMTKPFVKFVSHSASYAFFLSKLQFNVFS